MRNPRARVLPVVLALALVAAKPPEAHAAMAVVDGTAISKLTAQLNQLKRQFDEVVKVNEQLRAQMRAIGEAGRIAVPTLNIGRLAAQFRRDLACLTPDWRALMPGIAEEEFDLGSICARTAFYRRTLFADREALGDAGSGAERMEIRRRTNARRTRVLVDSVMKSLGQADQNQEDAAELTAAADDLEAAIASAETVNARLTAIALGGALNARAQALTVQILAQMQRADAAFYMATATTIEDAPAAPEGEEGER